MERFITKKLLKWKESPYRKPLILRGARQVGKTYIIKDFGNKYYDNMVYFNFEYDEGLKSLFKNTKDPKRIIEQLIFASGSKIAPCNTLIIFDEIQECVDALNSLKYFCEETPEYHIICAGSLLGIRLSHSSFPVGKVDFLNLYPMSFSEFLIADGFSNLVDYMSNINEIKPLEEIITSQLEEKLKAYFIVGGMPEVVNSWVNEKDILRVNYLQDSILSSYENDFAKHITNNEAIKVSLIWNGIPSELAKENKKFIYGLVKEGARAREYESALNWLNDADLVKKVYNVSKPSFPLKAYNDLSSFKIYMLDVGLLRRMSNLDSKIILEGNRLFEEFKGSFTENYCLNMLSVVLDRIPNYFVFDRYEIDFVMEINNNIVPIEVKSNVSNNHISLTRFNEKFNNETSIVFSMNNLSKNGKIVNIPLYLIEYLDNLIK